MLNSTHNTRHLTKFMKYTEYYRDKAKRIRQAWVAADHKRVDEIAQV